MVIIKLVGGLGNQMFQYAAGKAIALRSGTQLKMDMSWFKNQSGLITPRTYSLNFFNVEEKIATKKEVGKLKGGIYGNLFKVFQKIGLLKKGNYFFTEPSFNFHEEVLRIKSAVYLDGYWQSEKYLKGIDSDVIRREFTLKDEFDIGDRKITKEIKNKNAISLHIRRGDYVSNAEANKFHGICSLKYYANAIEYIAKKVNDPVFYIFSDDIKWVKENLKVEHPIIYVSDGILKDYEELMLMSYCRHNIIANSSFSWWGAWLNDNPDKIVIAPKQWFTDDNINISDLIPEAWVQL